jgi:hypothetical protein
MSLIRSPFGSSSFAQSCNNFPLQSSSIPMLFAVALVATGSMVLASAGDPVPGCGCPAKTACNFTGQPLTAYHKSLCQFGHSDTLGKRFNRDTIGNSTQGYCDVLDTLQGSLRSFSSARNGLASVLLDGPCPNPSTAANTCSFIEPANSRLTFWGQIEGGCASGTSQPLKKLKTSPVIRFGLACKSYIEGSSRFNTSSDGVVLWVDHGQKNSIPRFDQFCKGALQAKTVSLTWKGPSNKERRYACHQVIPANGGTYQVNATALDGGSFTGYSIMLISLGKELCKWPQVTTTPTVAGNAATKTSRATSVWPTLLQVVLALSAFLAASMSSKSDF